MLSKEIWEQLQGKEGIESVLQYPSSLIINLKKELNLSLKDSSIERIVQDNNQIEIIFKQSPVSVFNELSSMLNEKDKISFKYILNKIMEALAGSLVPLIPMLITAAMFKTLASVLGPDMLKLLSSDSNLYILFTFVGDAGFYFFPIVVGYTSAKTFGVTPVLGMFLGGILMHPTLIEMAVNGTAFDIYGIPMQVQNYSSTILPTILSVWIMSYIEKFFNKYVPEAIKTVFAPLLTFLIILPISLCLLAPLGNFAGTYLCNALLTLGNMGGIIRILTIAILGILWEFIIMGGLHWLFISTIFIVLAQNGSETIIAPMCAATAFSVGGMCFGAFLKQKSQSEKSATFSYMIAQIVGGVTEPGLYGIGFKYKKPFIGMMAGGFAGALYAGITHLTAYNFLPVANFLCFLDYAGGSTTNLINGIISGIIGFSIAAIVTFVIGIEK